MTLAPADEELSFVETPYGSELYEQALRLRDTVLRAPLGLAFTEEELTDKTSIGGISLPPPAGGIVVASLSLKALGPAYAPAQADGCGGEARRREGRSARGSSASRKAGPGARATGRSFSTPASAPRAFMPGMAMPWRAGRLRGERHPACQNDQAVVGWS